MVLGGAQGPQTIGGTARCNMQRWKPNGRCLNHEHGRDSGRRYSARTCTRSGMPAALLLGAAIDPRCR
eukprot:14389426-Alexandrium_andersonii.AAC.1